MWSDDFHKTATIGHQFDCEKNISQSLKKEIILSQTNIFYQQFNVHSNNLDDIRVINIPISQMNAALASKRFEILQSQTERL